MIITRSPLRISLGGGGTDFPSYYREFGGFVISAAIDVEMPFHQPGMGVFIDFCRLRGAVLSALSCLGWLVSAHRR